jgi:tetratricopeptide (TPR) repeat protein
MPVCTRFSFVLVCAALLPLSGQTPPDAARSFRLGTQALEKGDWATAIQQLERSRASSPRNPEVLFYLAQAYYQHDEYAKAMPVIAQAAKLAPASAPIAQKHGQYMCDAEVHCPAGLAELMRAKKLDPTLEDLDFDIGLAQYRMGRMDAARGSFEAELRRNSRHADAEFYLGEVLTRMGEPSPGNKEYEGAKSCYQRAIRDGGERAIYYQGLGRSMVALGEFEPAIPALTKALQLDPAEIEAHFQLAKALRGLGREQEGVHELEIFKAARDRLNVPSPLIPVKGAQESRVWDELRALADGGNEQAFLARVRQLDGRGNLWLRAGAVYCVMSKPEKALRALEKACQEEPASAEVRAWLGRARLLQKNVPAAEAEFQSALQLDGRNQTALAGLGELRYRQRRWREAARYLEDSQSKQTEVLVALCDSYFQLGDKSNGRITAELVRIFARDSQPAQDAVQRLLARYQ